MAVSGTNKVEKFSFDVQSGTHKVLVDVSKDLGGNDKAPSPHDLVEIALAACTAITIEMYAQRKQIPLQNIDVKVSYLKEGNSQTFFRKISFAGDLTLEQNNSCSRLPRNAPFIVC